MITLPMLIMVYLVGVIPTTAALSWAEVPLLARIASTIVWPVFWVVVLIVMAFDAVKGLV